VNYYVVLGVPQDADADTIRRAFRALARRYHPDAGRGSSVDRFRQIVTAYETLTDPIRRQAYDRSLGSRRPRTVEHVEPLVPHAAPEPLIGRRRNAAAVRLSDEPLSPILCDERWLAGLIDDLFEEWVDTIFGGGRRGR
jgi:curved DNA-binding protein CbpA